MVDAVVPGTLGEVRIPVVAVEHAHRHVVYGMEHDLAHVAHFAGAAGVVHHVGVVAGGGQAHGTGPRLHPGIGGDGHGALGLAVAFAHLEAGEAQELVVDLRVQGLAGDDRVLQFREVEGGQVLLDEVAIERGRGAKAGDAILGDHPQQVHGHELVVVVHEHRAAAQPLAVDLAPHRLGPAGVGHREVQAVLRHLLPVAGGEDVAQGIGEIVAHHLGIAGGARGEVEQRDVLVARGRQPGGPGEFGAGPGQGLVEVDPAGPRAAHRHLQLQGGRLRLRGVHVLQHQGVRRGHDQLDVRGVVPVDEVLGGELVGGGDGDGAQLVQRQQAEPELVAPLEDQHHRVALADAQGAEQVGGAVAGLAHLREGEAGGLAAVVAPDQGHLVGLGAGVLVHHVVGEVEGGRHIDLEMVPEVLVGVEFRLGEVALEQHGKPPRRSRRGSGRERCAGR